jgi:hypothetical protein
MTWDHFVSKRARRLLLAGMCLLGALPTLAQGPALDADHVITSLPMVNGAPGTPTKITNHLSRDSQGRTSYTDGTIVTINDPVARQTIVLDNSTLTYTVNAWPAAGSSGPTSIPYSVTQQNNMSQSSDLGTKNISGWPSQGMSFTVTTPANSPLGNSAPMQQQVEVWGSKDVALPMYVEVTDPNTGTTTEQFSSVTLADPSPQKFGVPPGFKPDPSLSKTFVTPQSTKKCRVLTTPNPLLLFSFFPFLGDGVVTALPNINRGCVLTNFAVFPGFFTGVDVITANPAIVQVEFFDLGLVPPFVPWVDVSLFFATASNGTSIGVGSDVVILTILN